MWMKQVCTPTLVVAHSQSGSQSLRSVSQSVRSVCQVSQVSQSASQVSQVSQSVGQSVSQSASEVSHAILGRMMPQFWPLCCGWHTHHTACCMCPSPC